MEYTINRKVFEMFGRHKKRRKSNGGRLWQANDQHKESVKKIEQSRETEIKETTKNEELKYIPKEIIDDNGRKIKIYIIKRG